MKCPRCGKDLFFWVTPTCPDMECPFNDEIIEKELKKLIENELKNKGGFYVS